jgi:hypothetical protein
LTKDESEQLPRPKFQQALVQSAPAGTFGRGWR